MRFSFYQENNHLKNSNGLLIALVVDPDAVFVF